MKNVVIEYNNKVYPLKPLSIENWIQMNSIMSYSEGYDDYITLIEFISGIEKEDILKASKWEIDKAIVFIKQYIDSSEHKFHNQFEFDGQLYRFIDLERITFGEFIDIDTFLMKSEIERKRELHFLMALLYREVDGNNRVGEYDATKIELRASKFKKLDIKYVHGAIVFFSTLRTMLRESTHWSLTKKLKLQMIRIKNKVLLVFGAGILLLYYYLVKTYSTLKKWQKKTFLSV